MTFEDYPVERIFVLQNPVSKNCIRGARQLADLLEVSGLPSITRETDCDPDATIESLSILEPTDLLYVIGGDGTVNSVIKPVAEAGALLLPTRSGNANDLAMSMNGRKKPRQVFKDYQRGKATVISSRPIQIDISTENATESRLAINYVSLGYAALASRYIDALPRSQRSIASLFKEAYALIRAAHDIDQFLITPEGTNEPVPIVDVSIAHSARMAKVGLFPIRHDDNFMLTATIAESNIRTLGTQFIKMMFGKMAVKSVESLSFDFVNPTNQALYYQVDGEASPLPNAANINISLAQKPVRILSTRLSEN